MGRIRATAIVLTGALSIFATLPVARAAADVAPVSDEFNGASLGAPWAVENPLGDASVSMSGTDLELTVPGGAVHDLWPGSEDALRVVQPISNGNFEVETKFDSMGSGQYQDQGIVVEQNSSTFLRFDVYSSGTGVTVFAASISGSTPSTKISEMVDNAQQPFWLRVKRTGSRWLFTYSKDGIAWVAAGTFDDTISVAKVGVYAGNSGPSPVGWTSKVDFFRSIVSSPINVADDNFNAGSLDTGRWSFVNPNGDATQTMDGSHAVINVPAGNDVFTHDPNASGNGAPRLMQSVSDGDFSFDAKFDSKVDHQFDEQGIVVQQDATHYLHADIVQGYYETYIMVYSVANGTVTTVAGFDPSTNRNTLHIYNQPSITLRLARTGDTWALGYSHDGTHWTAATAFILPLAVSEVGVFGGNQANTAQPFAMAVDSFLNTPTSSVGPAINVWYGTNQTFGSHGQPQQWVNILGDVSDVSGMASLTYTVNGGTAHGLSLGENEVRLVAPGEFNAEIDNASLNSGNNSVVFTAIDNDGNQSTKTVTVNKVTGNSWPLPYTANWSPAGGNVNGIAQITDGHWSIQGDGTIRNSDSGYDRLVAIGQASTWAQYIVTAQVRINSMDPDGSAVGIIAGWQGATGDLNGTPTPDQPRVGHPFPAALLYDNAAGTTPKVDLYANSDSHPEQSLQSDGSGLQLTPGQTYTFKMRVTDNAFGGSLFQVKVWPTGTTEPAAWLLQADGDLSRGSVVLAAHRADVSFGTVSVVGRPGAPTISSVAPLDGGAKVAFAAPANNGGTAITEYRANCTSTTGVAGSATGTTSPITVSGLDEFSDVPLHRRRDQCGRDRVRLGRLRARRAGHDGHPAASSAAAPAASSAPADPDSDSDAGDCGLLDARYQWPRVRIRRREAVRQRESRRRGHCRSSRCSRLLDHRRARQRARLRGRPRRRRSSEPARGRGRLDDLRDAERERLLAVHEPGSRPAPRRRALLRRHEQRPPERAHRRVRGHPDGQWLLHGRIRRRCVQLR